MENIGFIGMGNMAQALAGGFIRSGKTKKAGIYAYAPHIDKLKKNCEMLGINAVLSIEELVEKAEILIIACKPYQIEGALSSVKEAVRGKILISIAAGWDHERYTGLLGQGINLQYIMPNTPALVSEGVFLFEETNSLPDDKRREITELFSCMGMVRELPSNLMNAGMAITGCGPAFVDLMIEAYADAAVKYGIGREMAYKLVSQTILGSAKLQLSTGKHPGELKDAVCSPGGTTIRGVTELEKCGFRDACIASIDAILE